jgi:hypothetical protein
VLEEHATPDLLFSLKMDTAGSSKDLVPVYQTLRIHISDGSKIIAITVRNYLIAQAGNFKIRPVFIVIRNTGY